MRKTIWAGLFAVLFAPVMAAAQAPKGLGTEPRPRPAPMLPRRSPIVP